MLASTIKRTFVAFAMLLLPVAVTGQDPAPPPPAGPELSPEVQSWIMEMQEIQAELAPIEQQALADPELQAEQQELSADMQAAMVEIDPELEGTTERAQELQAEAAEAQEEGNQQKIMEVTAEAQQIQQRLAMAQTQALARPELASKVEAFQIRLQGKMVEIDPEAETLLSRFTELNERISGATQQPETP